jgi:Domain of unknown function (DUF4252)
MNKGTRAGARLACLALLLVVAGATANAQGTNSQRPSGLDRYEAEATDSVEVTIDERVLRLAASAIPEKTADDRVYKSLLTGLKSVYVRAFKFEREGVYQSSEAEALRSRFRGPEWSRVVGVRSRRYGDNVDVFLSSSGSVVTGMGVVVAGPRDLVYVNVEGPIDLQKLSQLEGRLRIPKLDLYVEGEDREH